MRVTYGDRIAACALEVAKKLILECGMEICPDTAYKMGKAKIAKSSKVPRNEMDSLVMLARLITAILPGMVEKPSSIMIIGDSK